MAVQGVGTRISTYVNSGFATLKVAGNLRENATENGIHQERQQCLGAGPNTREYSGQRGVSCS
jgi:hypothetical protein